MSKYYPELDHWFTQYWNTRGEVTVQTVNTPVTTGLTYENGNIFQLLFSETFPYDYYVFTFKQIGITFMPRKIVDRLCVKGTTPTIYLSDSTSYTYNADDFIDATAAPFDATSQPLTLEDIDHQMLSSLMEYRWNGATYDTTGFDTNLLTTDLSHLIYLYLEAMQTYDYSCIDDIIVYQPNSTDVVSNMFYLYVLNETHKKLKLDDIIIEGENVRTRIQRLRLRLTNETILSPCVPVNLSGYIETGGMYVYINSFEMRTPDHYTITDATDSTDAYDYTFCFDPVAVSAREGDYIVIDYYTSDMTSEIYDPDTAIYSWEDGTTNVDEE